MTQAECPEIHPLYTGFEQVIHILLLITLYGVAGLDFRVSDYADFAFSVARYGYIIALPKL